MKSCVTIALVPSIQTGPWIYWHDLSTSMAKAADLGFDAVELFTPSADAVSIDRLMALSNQFGLDIAAVGTGAGKVLHGLTLTDPDPAVRSRAVAFISDMITFGARFGAPAIIGSMQGNAVPGVEKEQALDWLAEGVNILGKRAEEQGVNLIYEPLNRYETNLINRLEDGVTFLKSLEARHVVLLADLFHMNIEEVSLADSIRSAGSYTGHVHFADSNRRPIGCGHTALTDVAAALKEMDYQGYISAEAFPWPDPDEAAKQTIAAFKQYFG
ncbi:sugar phosphate isomerase/epimerase family protein [Larkinella humicola]|uniref:Sugar phosphate isomerase/epimerase n=1 Tax=Larkinella humicola TaxID=2607654 RepID=A0A5N1JCX6_9BACT|nr:sugar phosphate isomerase/epimerase family protein [Larkinella humicola]KAA9346993.1 sugar phosphate isomerase/epimerase [Larkinella humicola]